MESRRLLSADLADGVLTIVGTNQSDHVEVGVDGGSLLVTVNDSPYSFNLAEVGSIHINAGNGHDTVLVDDAVVIPCLIDGETGDDWLKGGGGDDVIHGDQGKDHIEGSPGNDELYGDNGKDDLDGGYGEDQLDGGNGKDECLGGEDNDTIHGGRGKDHLDGGGGENVLDGDDGADAAVGGLTVDLDNELKALLIGSSGASGEAEIELHGGGHGMHVEFEVEVEGADPDATYDVWLDDVLVGQITTDGSGEGELEFKCHGGEPGEAGFPDGFPEIGVGSVIRVGTILEGTFFFWNEPADDCGCGG